MRLAQILFPYKLIGTVENKKKEKAKEILAIKTHQ